MTEEEYCHWNIKHLQESYQKAIQQYVDILVRIKSLEPTRMIISPDAVDPAFLKAQEAQKEQTKQVAPFLSDAPIELIEQWAKMPTKIPAAPKEPKV